MLILFWEDHFSGWAGLALWVFITTLTLFNPLICQQNRFALALFICLYNFSL